MEDGSKSPSSKGLTRRDSKMRNSLGASNLSRKSSTMRLRNEVSALQTRGRRGSLSGEIGRPIRRVDSSLRRFQGFQGFQGSRSSGQTPPTATNKQMVEINIPAVEDEATLRAARLDVLSKISVFSALSTARLMEVLDAMREVTFEDGDLIVKQGDYSSTFFVIEEGLVDITRRFVAENEMEKPHRVAQRGPLEYFGEFGLLFAKRRSANCIARGKVKCLALERKDFDKLLLSVQQLMHARAVVKQSGYFDVSPIFSHLSKLQQQHTIEMLKPVVFKRGQTIYKKGDDGKIFYFIVTGRVEFHGLQGAIGSEQDKGAQAGEAEAERDGGASESDQVVEELVLHCASREGDREGGREGRRKGGRKKGFTGSQRHVHVQRERERERERRATLTYTHMPIASRIDRLGIRGFWRRCLHGCQGAHGNSDGGH